MIRVARAVAIVFAVAVVAWLCSEAAPGAPGERAARAAGLLPADDSAVPAETRAAIVAEVAHAHGLDRSGPRRFARFIGGVLVFDFGRSWRDGASVRRRVGRALARTAALVAVALACAIAFGIGAAFAGARRPGKVLDVGLSGVAAIAVAVPAAWVGLIALRTFAYGSPWRWMPTGGLESLSAWVLPVFTLAVVPAFIMARYARAAVLEATRAPWAVAAVARGMSRPQLLQKALRTSAASLTAVSETLVVYLLGASVVVERVFDIKGLGHLLVDASARGDAPVVIGVTVAAGAVMAVASLASGLARSRLDPRLREVERGDRVA